MEEEKKSVLFNLQDQIAEAALQRKKKKKIKQKVEIK